MWYLKARLYILLAVLFGIVYTAVTVIGTSMGVTSFNFYLILSLGLMFIQYMVGPKIVEWSMKVKYVGKSQYPRLHQIIEELAEKAGIPKPKVGVAQIAIPNAFAFGRGAADGRVCVTTAIVQLLDERELRAVLGHEISHLKNRDVLFITVLSVIPMILYRLAWHFLWFGGGRRRNNGVSTTLIGLAAFLFYFITNLLVLYGSRIREYFADMGSVALGNQPEFMASALYKLVYGSARMSKQALKDTEGLKAFFVNDPSRARKEINELAQIDLDRSGTIDASELAAMHNKELNLSFGDKMFEAFSTHPNMLKRIKQLSKYKM
ncbi:MAG: zinc metalloprotease HtpX [Candidatus Omnitrophota bacterium]